MDMLSIATVIGGSAIMVAFVQYTMQVIGG